ncbi:MAG: SRPBCC family protein [Pyrinomonadaceae bacterium]
MPNKTTITAEPGKQELFIIREFDAPRELVYKAHTDPALYAQWVGPNDLTMTVDELNAKHGGKFRFVHERSGHKYTFFGVYHEALAPERIIGTFEFDGLPETGHVILGTTKFEELPGGRTRLVHQSVFQSVQDRDGMIQSGMERGVNEGYDKLDAILAESSARTSAA